MKRATWSKGTIDIVHCSLDFQTFLSKKRREIKEMACLRNTNNNINNNNNDNNNNNFFFIKFL